MTNETALGWAVTILDTVGAMTAIRVVIFIFVAAAVWTMFRPGGRD